MQRLEQRVLAQPIAALAHERLRSPPRAVAASSSTKSSNSRRSSAYFARAAAGQSINVPSCRSSPIVRADDAARRRTRIAGSANSGLRNSRLDGE